jgi:hypothetical protein
MDKRIESSAGALDSLKQMARMAAEQLRRRVTRRAEHAGYISAEAQTRAFNRGMRAVRRHQRIGQTYALPGHIQRKLAMR